MNEVVMVWEDFVNRVCIAKIVHGDKRVVEQLGRSPH